MRLIDADAFKEYITDGFKYIMTEFKTDRVRDLAYQVTYDFCRDIDEAPTVNAIPIKALYELKSEVEKHISQPRGYIKEVYEMGKDNAYENVLELIDMKILEYGSNAE